MLLEIAVLLVYIWGTYCVGSSLYHWGTTITSKQILKNEVHNINRDVLVFNGITFLAFLTWTIEQINKVLEYA